MGGVIKNCDYAFLFVVHRYYCPPDNNKAAVNEMQDPTKLGVYQDAINLAADVYKMIKPIQGEFRLKEQLNASLTAVFANLAEMGGFDNPKQIAQKIRVCIGECNEAQGWLEYLLKVELMPADANKAFINRVKTLRMQLYSLLKAVENKSPTR